MSFQEPPEVNISTAASVQVVLCFIVASVGSCSYASVQGGHMGCEELNVSLVILLLVAVVSPPSASDLSPPPDAHPSKRPSECFATTSLPAYDGEAKKCWHHLR